MKTKHTSRHLQPETAYTNNEDDFPANWNSTNAETEQVVKTTLLVKMMEQMQYEQTQHETNA
eukprot:5068131-Amphidinium_carterae.2